MSSNNGTQPTTAPSSEPPSSTPVTLSSSSPAQSSTPPPSSTPVPSSSTPVPTSVITASSKPPSTQVITSYITPSTSIPGQTPSVIVITSVVTNTDQAQSTIGTQTGSASSTSSTTSPSLQGNEGKSKSSGGLSDAGRTAIAVVIPVVVVALLVLAGLFLWKKRKQRKNAEEARRKEVEEYGFNPNNDPTLPAVGMASEMAEDQSGYRGWGNSSTTRKASTTLNSGLTYSDPGSNPGGYASPGSPTAAHSDGYSVDPLVNGRRETLDSEGIAALGTGPGAGQNRTDIHRGPSNASSSYSAANRSDNSGEYPIPVNNPQDYYDNYQPGPYGDPYGGAQQPVIRDVSARRNTRIENPSVFPQQGNSGIAQNF